MNTLVCPRCGMWINKHPANRCLDGWVAEQALGIKVMWGHGDPSVLSDDCFEEEEAGEMVTLCKVVPCKQYSVDDVAALTIVDTLSPKGQFVLKRWLGGLWKCKFWGVMKHQAYAILMMRGRTRPLAICRAAIRATGGWTLENGTRV